ncbi:hypothetical protein [Hymenobacter fodinae]|nr:hypothetical protein [Hymenobacter fodinae]
MLFRPGGLQAAGPILVATTSSGLGHLQVDFAPLYPLESAEFLGRPCD